MNIYQKFHSLKNFVLIFFVILIGVLIYFAYIPRPVKVDTHKIKKGTFVNVISSDGILRARERYTISAISDGDIKRIDLKVGDEVRKGEPVAELIRDVTYIPVRSPIKGVVSKVYRESSGPVRRGEPLVELVDPNNLEVVTELLTTDATQIELGDPIYGTGWGGDGLVRGKVIRISKAGFIKTSALGVEEEKTEVIGDISETSAQIISKLGSNFHLDVSIEIERVEDALKIPIGALFRSGNEWAVYKVVDKRAVETQVVIKTKGSDEALIVSGLSEGDIVIIYPGDLVEDGTRIKY